MSQKRAQRRNRILLWVAGVVILFFCLFPFYWLINTSLKTGPDLSSADIIPPRSGTPEFEKRPPPLPVAVAAVSGGPGVGFEVGVATGLDTDPERAITDAARPVVEAARERGLRGEASWQHSQDLGGGWYDRLLPGLRPDCLTVGVGFDIQLRPELPTERHDVGVQCVVTETRTLRPGHRLPVGQTSS